MLRYEESRKDDYDDAVKRGLDNQECLNGMLSWCQNVRINRESEGLYAQMSGLPIATHTIECPHVDGSIGSMNLRWIFNNFLRDHCDGCPHHASNGDTSWAESILKSQRDQSTIRNEKFEAEKKRITDLRGKLIEHSKLLAISVPAETKEIVRFVEHLFSDQVSEREEASLCLIESACLAPDLFPSEAVSLLIELAATEDHAAVTLPICIALGEKATEVRSQLLPLARQNIEARLHVRLSAELLNAVGDAGAFPLPEACVTGLFLDQQYEMHPVAWSRSHPDYSSHLKAIERSYDASPESVLAVLRGWITNTDQQVRTRFLGGLRLLQASRPQVAVDLTETLVNSLHLYENKDGGSKTPSGQIVKILAAIFARTPKRCDEILARTFCGARAAVQEDIIGVYSEQFRQTARKRVDSVDDQYQESLQIASGRLLNWIKDDTLDLELRVEATDAFEKVCNDRPSEAIEKFDLVFGILAMIMSQDAPPDLLPKILIPGEVIDPRMAGLDAYRLKQNWYFLKQRLTNCLQSLAESLPDRVYETVAGCFGQPSGSVGDELRATCMMMLGTVGKRFEFRAKVLPLMMKGMMNYESTLVRAKAIDATGEMFRHSTINPPTNVVDVINVHLQDQYNMVHQAAVSIVSRNADWFTDTQAFDAMRALSVHLTVYKSEPYQVNNVCDAILALASQHPQLMNFAVALVNSAVPTGEPMADEKILDQLVWRCPSDSEVSATIASMIGNYFASVPSDRINGYEHEREHMFEWLYNLPPKIYGTVAESLFAHALQLAKRDPWEVCRFASLFSINGDFSKESAVLEEAGLAIPDEPRSASYRKSLLAMACIASGNASLVVSDIDAANAHFAKASELL